MRKFGLAVAAVALAAVVGATSVEAQSSSRIIVGGGSTLGLSDISEDANGGFSNGPHLILGYEYVSKSGFGFRLDGMYHRIGGNDAAAPGGGPLLSQRLDVLNGTANALYVFKTAGNFKPYLIAGVGYYNVKLGGELADALGGVDGRSEIGFNAGAGFEGGSGPIKFFGEARFHQIQLSEDTDPGSFNARVAPISVGVKIPVGAK